MTQFNERELIRRAEEARAASYCPYSHKSVGAALLTDSGKIYTGANIENGAFSPSLCAERVAFATAVHQGEREFTAIAVAGGDEGEKSIGFNPCGVCRESMREFVDDSFTVLVSYGSEYKKYSFSELYPICFSGIKE